MQKKYKFRPLILAYLKNDMHTVLLVAQQGEFGGAQIDMLIERADRVINLCEMKYSIYPYALDKAESLKIRTRIGDFVAETGAKESIFPTLITTYGLRAGEYSSMVQAVVTMDDLFAE